MKYLKTFENYNEPKDITEDIAEDLLPKLQQLRDEKGSLTVDDFDNYMRERGADSHTIDLVISNLVSMGFDFDSDSEEETDDLELQIKNI
jgi:hypothetical protein